MPIIIDGYNYIGAIGDISLSDIDKEEKLVHKMSSVAAIIKNKITIVFDGQKNSIYREGAKYKKGNINVIISSYNNSADDVIKKMINKSDHKRDLTIISSDREVYSYAIKKGSKAIHCREFEKQLQKDNLKKEKETPHKLSVHEIEYWLKEFKNK